MKTLYIDGGCSGNMKKDYFKRSMVSVVVDKNNQVISEKKENNGGSNNIAKFLALRDAVKWCIENKCFLIDNNGIIFEEIFENYSELPTIKSFNANGKFALPADATALQAGLGQEVVEKETLSKVLQIISKLKQNLEIQIKLADIVSKERLNIKTSENWEIYFNLLGDIDWQITELGLILEKEIDSEKRQKLEYIDLRFNRVFYK